MFLYHGDNEVPKDVTSVTIDESVTYIKVRAFQNCTEITNVNIPSNVAYIGENAFEGCISLLSVNFSQTLTFLGDHVFKGCKSLLYINIPNSITFIGDHAFYGCDELLSRITNYRNIFGLIKDRFKYMPLHDVCSSHDVTVEAIESTIQRLKEKSNNDYEGRDSSLSTNNLDAKDTWDFTALHVLCCNSKATSEMIHLLLQHMGQEMTILKTSGGMTPLELYMACRNDLRYDLPLCLALQLGMKWEGVKKMLTDDGLDTLEQGMKDYNTLFYPFMLAAVHPSCDLECLYHLALFDVTNIAKGP